jgi:hypothetical protein
VHAEIRAVNEIVADDEFFQDCLPDSRILGNVNDGLRLPRTSTFDERPAIPIGSRQSHEGVYPRTVLPCCAPMAIAIGFVLSVDG